MGCCCTIPCIVWLWEWGNPLSVATSSDGSTVGSMSSSDQRWSGCMCVHVPNRCYAAPPLSPSTIYSLYILLKVLPLFRDSTNSIHIEQLIWLCRSSKWSLRTLVVSLWPSWATFMVLCFRLQFRSILRISPHALLTMHFTSSRWWPPTASIKLFSIKPHPTYL